MNCSNPARLLLAAAGLAAGTARGASFTRSVEFTDLTPGAELIRAVATDSAGNVYLAGRDMGSPPKHWIARLNPNGALSWVRHSGDGFPDLIAQGEVEAYGAAVIAGHLVVVGTTRTAFGAPQTMGFIANFDTATGNLQGLDYNPGYTGLNAGFHAVAADPSDATLAWVAGVAGVGIEGENGWLAKYNVNPATPVLLNQVNRDANAAMLPDAWYAITVTPGAVMLGGRALVGGTPAPWWVRYDKGMAFQQNATHGAPAGQTDGVYVGLVMAAGRLYAAAVGGSGGSYDSLEVRELNPATGSLLVPKATLKTDGPLLGPNTWNSCGIAAHPATGRILVADFDLVWDLQPDLGIHDTLFLPAGWQTDTLASFGDGRFATAGWHQTGNPGTAAVWSPPTTTASTPSTTVSVDAGSLKIAPNVIDLSRGGWAGFHVRGTPGAPFTIRVYDTAGRRLGEMPGTCDAAGAGVIRFHGGLSSYGDVWDSDNPLAPGAYWAVADGPGISAKPRAFSVLLRRVK